MASKALLVFAALLAVVLLVSSEVAARELAEETQEKNVNKAGIEEQKYPYGGGYPGGGYNGGGYPGRGYGGYPGGGYGGYPGRGNGGYPGRGGYCRWGCCRRGYYGGCQCCAHPDEIPEPMYQPEVHN